MTRVYAKNLIGKYEPNNSIYPSNHGCRPQKKSLKYQVYRNLYGSGPRLHCNISYRVCTEYTNTANYRRWPPGCLGSARHSAMRDEWLLDLPHLDGVRFTPKFNIIFINQKWKCLTFEHLTNALSKKSDLLLYSTARYGSWYSQTHKNGHRHQNQMLSRLPYSGKIISFSISLKHESVYEF